MEYWLRTDEREDILCSLRMLSLACDEATIDLAAWKWVVTVTHSALQSAMAFHLGFGNDLLVARLKDAQKWLRAHRDGTPYPNMMMDNFLSLYEKLGRHSILGYKFVPKETTSRCVSDLNEFRNEFTHFMPKGWSIEVSGLPAICIDAIEIIEELNEKALPARWESEEQMAQAHALLAQCRSKLTALRDTYTHG